MLKYGIPHVQELLRRRRALPRAVPGGRPMKVPVQWLADHLGRAAAARRARGAALARGRQGRGRRAPRPARGGRRRRSSIVAGHVLEAGKHPNADRLQLTQVDVGEAAPRQIVCGAWNFGAGDTVAVALPGTALLDGRRIGRSKLRGETSDGMILSERELDISSEGDGIMVLGEGWRPGEPLARARAALPRRDRARGHVQPRRPALDARRRARGARDLRRRAHAARRERAARRSATASTIDWVSVAIEDEELCPRFTRARLPGRHGRALAALAQGAAAAPRACARSRTSSTSRTTSCTTSAARCTPTTTRTLARRAPDRAPRAAGGDGSSRSTARSASSTPSMLVIADAEGPQGIAGHHGRRRLRDHRRDDHRSCSRPRTSRARRSCARRSALGLRSDSSNRWEKGVASRARADRLARGRPPARGARAARA